MSDAPLDMELEGIFSQCAVDQFHSSSLLEEGWNVRNFACLTHDPANLDAVMSDLIPGAELTLLQKSALKAAFLQCQQQVGASPAPAPLRPAESSSALPPSGTWAETFAPKLDHDVIQKMKKQFVKNYPSELVNPDTMPSTRLLSLVYNQVSKKHWVWIPWKFRLSVSKSEEVSSQRPAKLPRLETSGLSALLLDDPPSLEISNAGMGINAIRNLLAVHDYAVAMCNGAHLANLKAYSHKFLAFLTQRVDADSGLRCASVTESQSADRQIWQTISDLMLEREWSMDECLHEVTHIRHDLPSLLQLRPRPARPMAGPSTQFTGKGKPSGKPQGGKGKSSPSGKGKTLKVRWVTEISKDGQRKQLCMRWQVGKCQLGQACKFEHGCAHPTTSGAACGLNHTALQHQSTPH